MLEIPQSAHKVLDGLQAQPRNFKNWLLDTSIYYSFDQTGFFRHLNSAPAHPKMDTIKTNFLVELNK